MPQATPANDPAISITDPFVEGSTGASSMVHATFNARRAAVGCEPADAMHADQITTLPVSRRTR